MATIAENIQRIQAAKASLKTQIEAKGVTVPSSATIDTYPTYVSQIPAGGGDDSTLRDFIERDITSITIPSGTTSIGNYSFAGCDGLTSIIIPDSVTSINTNAFYQCSGLTEITIPDSVTSIGNQAFAYCYSLTSVTIGSGVTSIGNQAFVVCSGLTSVSIGSGVTSIGQSAFNNCSSLTSVTIPDSVTSIDNQAFRNCSGLTNVTVNATTPPTLGGTTAFQNTNNCPIYVPSASVETYKAASGWSTYASRIQAITE